MFTGRKLFQYTGLICEIMLSISTSSSNLFEKNTYENYKDVLEQRKVGYLNFNPIGSLHRYQCTEIVMVRRAIRSCCFAQRYAFMG